MKTGRGDRLGAGGGVTGVFVLRLLAVSIALYLAWTRTGLIDLYVRLVAWGAGPLVALAGHSLAIEQALKMSEEISLNPVVYLSLVIAATGVPWRGRIRPALLGVLILSVANVAVVFLVFMAAATEAAAVAAARGLSAEEQGELVRTVERMWAGAEFLNLTINFFLPIMLWFLLLPARRLFPFTSSRA